MLDIVSARLKLATLSRRQYASTAVTTTKGMELTGFPSAWNDLDKGCSTKDLLTRITGRFYTPALIADHLVRAVAEQLQGCTATKIRLIDPFCGDGRLVVAFLEQVTKMGLTNKAWQISLWDCDSTALDTAQRLVQERIFSLGLNAKLVVVDCDTFEEAQLHFGQYDVVITNPPWDVLKPDRRELQSLHELQRASYIDGLRRRDARLSNAFPMSCPSIKFSGWGLNLARVGSEAALRLCRQNGVVGLVSPVGLFADQVSSKFRRWLFSEYALKDVAYFPAEARLFENVDHSAVTLVCLKRRENGISAKAFRLSKTFSLQSDGVLRLSNRQLTALDFAIPIQLGMGTVPILESFSHLPKFSDLEAGGALWAGRELDETHWPTFTSKRGNIPFLKGRMIGRYQSLVTAPLFLDARKRPVPNSSAFSRVGWRDVSRPSQKRRMHAAIVQPGSVTGNSVHVAYFRDQTLARSLVLLAVMNSFVFEFQVRARLATPHVSLGTVRRSHLPEFSAEPHVWDIVKLTAKLLHGEHNLETDLEIAIAKAYGCSRDMFAHLLEYFDKVPLLEKQSLLAHSKWKRTSPPLVP